MNKQFTSFLPHRALSLISGPDAESFLQGLLTCDVAGLTPGEARYGALLTPQGKIIADMILIRLEDGFLMDCAASARAALLAKLSLYKLRSKVELKSLEGGVVAGLGEVPPGAIIDPRTPLLGFRLYGASRGGDVAEYEAHRISVGIADSELDIGEAKLFPHEANFDQLHGVSFTKGCYVGQEIVSRMEHKNMSRSRILIAEFADAAPSSGSAIVADGGPIGSVLSTSGKQGLVLLRLDRLANAQEKPAGMTIKTAPWAGYSIDG